MGQAATEKLEAVAAEEARSSAQVPPSCPRLISAAASRIPHPQEENNIAEIPAEGKK